MGFSPARRFVSRLGDLCVLTGVVSGCGQWMFTVQYSFRLLGGESGWIEFRYVVGHVVHPD